MHRLVGSRRAFTLIELLVVVAIIAILAAILFPMMYRAREAGRRAKCSQNLRQIHSALLMYADDYSQRLPWANAWYNSFQAPVGNNPPPPDPRYVGYLLIKYQKNKLDLWKCPSNPYKPNDIHFWNWVYYYNLFGYDVKSLPKCPDPSSLAGQSVERPDFTVSWMPDKNGVVKSWVQTRLSRIPLAWDQRKTHWNDKTGTPDTDAEYSLMHYDGWNVLFLDGHTKYYYERNRSPYQPE